MNNIRSAPLFVCLWATLTLAAGARAWASEDIAGGVALTLFWATVYAAGLWFARERQGAAPKPVLDGIAALGICAFILELLTGNLVQALMSLLLWLQAARNPALVTRRDVYFALCVSLTLIMFGTSEARSTAFLTILVPYALTALAVLVHCHQQSGLDLECTDALAMPATCSPSLRHMLAIAACICAIALPWYLLVPRPAPVHLGVMPSDGGKDYTRDDWEREARSGQDGTDVGKALRNRPGPSRDERPRDADEELDIRRSAADAAPANDIVMYVQADRTLYLRTRSYDRFENNRWSRTDGKTKKLLPERGNFSLSTDEIGDRVNYVVQVVAPITSALPLSAHAISVKAPAGVIAQGRDGSVYMGDTIVQGFRYSAVSTLSPASERPIAGDVLTQPSLYLQLPSQTPRIRALARQVTAAVSSPFDKARALEAHLRTAYQYSFETILTSQNNTPLEEFLFETRRGHCEFFASAMAVMLREIGIPSRVLHGYLAHGFNPVTGLYEVRRFDGHAWVEAYFDELGWVNFEPTAAYPIPRPQAQSGTTLKDLKSYTEQLAKQEALQGKTGVLAAMAAVLRELNEVWQLLLFALRTWLGAVEDWLLAHLMPLAGAAIAGVLLAAAAYRYRARLIWLWANVAVHMLRSEALPVAALRHLERVARARKLARAQHETVEEYLERIQAAYSDLHAELRLLRQAFNATRYGQRTLSKKETGRVMQAFSRIGGALAEHL